MAETNNAGMNIRKQTDTIDKQEKQLGRLREEIKAKCTHTRNGELQLVPSNNRQPGELKYFCKVCRKEITLSKLPEETLTNAIDALDRACDVIKISLDANREDDAKILKRISKTQFRLRNELLPLYGASLKKSNRGAKRNNNNNNSNNGNGMWERPQVSGR